MKLKNIIIGNNEAMPQKPFFTAVRITSTANQPYPSTKTSDRAGAMKSIQAFSNRLLNVVIFLEW